METYKFDCGCEFPILDPKIKEDGLPSIKLDYDNISLKCPKAWTIFAEGLTKGVFQLERELGQDWSRKVQPISILEVSDLISIIRPGTLKFMYEDKSMTQHYVDRKHLHEDCESLDPSIDHIMQETYQVMIYQEQAMQIAQVVAGFDLKQADNLRKAIGKKLADLMAKVKKEFLAGAEKTGIVTEGKAKLIFENIEKSARYAFNKSHAASYAKTGYYCAFVKAHFPLQFYTSWLRNARNKPDFTEEAAELISDAIAFDIKIKTPSIISMNEDFKIEDKKIRYGLGAIKGVGEKAVHKLIDELGLLAKNRNKDIKDCSWLEILLLLSPNIKSDTFSALICSGAMSHLGMYRQRMLYEYNKLLEVTGKNELPWLQANIDSFSSLSSGIKSLLETDNVKKVRKEKVLGITKVLDNPTSELIDNEGWVADTETKLFGIALSCNKLDTCDVTMRDTTCAAFKYKEAKSFTFAVYISKVSDYIPKAGKLAGKRMLYLTLNDHTGSIKAVAFPDCIKDYDYLLFKGNTIAVVGRKSDKGGLTLSKVIQI